MMDLATIRELAEEAAERAAEIGTEPAVFSEETLAKAREGDLSGIRIPNLGTHLPEGWARVNLAQEYVGNPHGLYMGDNDGFGAYFVEKGGWGGRGGGPDLTINELVKRLKPGLGYAMVEEGQFQCKVGAFAVRTDL